MGEVLTARKKAEVFVDRVTTADPRFARRPFHKKPDFAMSSVNYSLESLLTRGKASS